MPVYDEIRQERERQDRKYGGPAHDDNHTTEEWLSLIQAQEYCTHRVLRVRLIRVAALAVARVESFDRVQERTFGLHQPPARRASEQLVQTQTLAHPEPELFYARLKDIDDLGFNLLPDSLGLAAMKSREALMALIQRLLLQNDQALAQGKVYPTAAAVSALSTILRDLLDDLRVETDAAQVQVPIGSLSNDGTITHVRTAEGWQQKLLDLGAQELAARLYKALQEPRSVALAHTRLVMEELTIAMDGLLNKDMRSEWERMANIKRVLVNVCFDLRPPKENGYADW